jgi:hypothetical protein
MNGFLPLDDPSPGYVQCGVAQKWDRFEAGMTPMMTFFVALGVTSAACYVLLVRADRKRVRRRSGSDSGADSSGASGSDGFSFASWFGNTASTDVMGNPIDGGGFDGGGGGDGGGGDGGGGGGGD